MPIRHSLQADHLTKIKWSAAFYPFVRPLFYSVHPSTITREVQRNSNRDNQYVFTIAQRKCESRKHSILGNHRKDETLWWRVEQMIKDEDWSPRQISGVLAKESIHICAQTIYNHVYADTKGELAKHMPHELRYRCRE